MVCVHAAEREEDNGRFLYNLKFCSIVHCHGMDDFKIFND